MVRITEGLGVLALAADAATGRPRGSGLSAAIVAAEFSRRIGEDLATQKDAYFLALVRFIGCTITSHETGMLSFGDDQGFQRIGFSILRIRYLVPRKSLVVPCLFLIVLIFRFLVFVVIVCHFLLFIIFIMFVK